MRNVLFGLLIVLFAAVVTKAPGPRVSSTTDSGSIRTVTVSTGGCDASVNTVRTSGRRLIAAARFTCANPGPDALTMTVALQKQAAGGAWTTIAAQKFGAAGENTTRAHTNASRTRAVSAACARGVYRTTATVTSVRQKAAETTTRSSSARTNPCG